MSARNDDLIIDSSAESRERIRSIISRSLDEAFLPKIHELKSAQLKVDKVLYGTITRDLEASLIPAADSLMQRIERIMSEKIATLESQGSPSYLKEKIESLKARLEQLENAVSTTSASTNQIASHVNPYVEIEQRVAASDWISAWRKAVEVYNGIDFMIHLMGSSTPEEFFSANPIDEPLLVLQICINTGKEILQSDRSIGVKIEIINELILSLNNPGRLNLSHQFAQLREVIQQVTLKAQSPRLREVQKIILATERLMTPPVSIESTPMPSRYATISPAPMYS
jgi:hypothetical protein